jgi:hypothetical protein
VRHGAEREALTAYRHQEPFPAPPVIAALEAIQANPLRINPSARHRWDELYPRFESMTRSVQSARDGVTPYRRWGTSSSTCCFCG